MIHPYRHLRHLLRHGERLTVLAANRLYKAGTTNSVKTVPIAIPATKTMPMLLRASAPGPVTKHERIVTADGRYRRHQHRSQSRLGSFDDGCHLAVSRLLQMIGKLDNQDPILGHQADQGNQAHLGINVDGSQPKKSQCQCT